MRWLLVLLVLGCRIASAAEDTIYLEETVITGNQELPKVLYILPWQEMESTALPQREFEFAHQSVLAPIYPHEHKREVALRRVLQEAREEVKTQTIESNLPE